MKPVRRSPNPTSRSLQQQKNNDQTEVSINEFMSRLRELEKIAVEKFRNKGQKQLNILSNSGIKRFNQGFMSKLEKYQTDPEIMSRLRELEKIAVEKFRNKGQKQLNILSNSGIKRFNQGLLPELKERPHYIPNIHMAGFDDPDKKKK